MKFDQCYFDKAYIHYNGQNPLRKLIWYRSVIERFLPNKSAVSLLDIGCGPGAFLEYGAKGWKRTGIDPAIDLLQCHFSKLTESTITAGVVEHIPFKTKFSLVTAFDVLEHSVSPEQAAHSINDILADNGLVCFVVPVYDGPLGDVVQILDRDSTHLHRLSRSAWLQWTQTHFSLVWWCGIFRYYLLNRWYIHLPVRGLRSIAPAILVIAKKKFK
jgi:SAM-dependent methyltransferase